MKDAKPMITLKPHQALAHLKPYLPENPIIVEAGAYDGRETVRLARLWPAGTVCSFEPVPELFEKLQQNTAEFSNIRCYQNALSDSTGTATLHISENPTKPGRASQANSLLKPEKRLELSPLIFPRTLQVPTITIDDWAKECSIDHVDFLKLDVQGYELNIIKASPIILATVKVILTEVEFVQAYQGQYLYPEVKSWLESQGFTMIAKDFSNEVDWFFGNALFIRE